MRLFTRIAFAAFAAMFLATAGPPTQASEKGNAAFNIDLKRMDAAAVIAGADMQISIANPLDLAAALEVGVPGHSVVGLVVSGASNDGGVSTYKPIVYIPMGIGGGSANLKPEDGDGYMKLGLKPVEGDSPIKAHDPADRVDKQFVDLAAMEKKGIAILS